MAIRKKAFSFAFLILFTNGNLHRLSGNLQQEARLCAASGLTEVQRRIYPFSGATYALDDYDNSFHSLGRRVGQQLHAGRLDPHSSGISHHRFDLQSTKRASSFIAPAATA
jgi:hypothetical protein